VPWTQRKDRGGPTTSHPNLTPSVEFLVELGAALWTIAPVGVRDDSPNPFHSPG